MNADQYLASLIRRETVDTGENSQVRGVIGVLRPTLLKWGNKYLAGIAPSGSFAKGTAIYSGTDIDLFLSLRSDTPANLRHIYVTLFNAMEAVGYSPFMQHFKGQLIVPAESVYGVLESKQEIDASQIKYASKKIASVRKLHRTSLPIPHAGGRYRAKKPGHILGGLLAFDSGWTPPLGKSLLSALKVGEAKGRLDIGCAARHGIFWCEKPKGKYVIAPSGQAATAFLLELIARLQQLATVPMIDVRAYAKWLSEER
jgi:hypothetical protein